jgi:hypothetical protein
MGRGTIKAKGRNGKEKKAIVSNALYSRQKEASGEKTFK